MVRVKRWIPAAIAVAGLALVVWQVRSVGLGEIIAGFQAVGPLGFACILLLSGARYVLRSLSWMALVTPADHHRPVPLRTAVAATVSGDALGNLSFLSLLVSEPAKALYLSAHVPADEALGALTAENFFYSVSVALVIVAGTLTLLATFVLPDAWRSAAYVSIGLMAVILLAALWLVWKRPGFISRIQLRPDRRLARALTRLHDIERLTYRGLRSSPWRMATVAVCMVAFHVCSVLESWLTLYLLTGSSDWLHAFLFDTLNRIINVAFRIVPLRVGVDEVSASGLSDVIGLGTAAGLTLALVRKARVLTWVAVGLGLVGLRALRRG